MRQRVLLDRRRQLAQRLPFGNAVRLRVAFLAQIPQPLVVERDMVRLLDELAAAFAWSIRASCARPVENLRDMDEACVAAFMRSAQPC